MWIKAPSSVSSVTRRSTSKVPSPLAVTQSPPPGSTLPRSRSPSKEPPTTGKIDSVPSGVEPISSMAAVARRRVMRGRDFMRLPLERIWCPGFVALPPRARDQMSEHFVDGIDRTLSATVAARHGDQAIQERVCRISGLEAWRGSKVVACRIDGLAPPEGRDHFGRSVTQAERLHRDQRAIVGPQRRAQVQLEDPVAAEAQPVRAAAGQDRASKPRASEVAAAQRDGAPRPAGYGADVQWRRHADLKRHEQTRVHRWFSPDPIYAVAALFSASAGVTPAAPRREISASNRYSRQGWRAKPARVTGERPTGAPVSRGRCGRYAITAGRRRRRPI